MLLSNWSELLSHIVSQQDLHCRWLATLSHLENCGARKIVSFEPQLGTPLEVLQHAAEECRHAFYFKNQIRKLARDPNAFYPLLGGGLGKRYLHHLDASVCRLAKNMGFPSGRALKEASYLVTTYCIEVRASELYPLYETVLRSHDSPISFKSIIKEEEGHLAKIGENIKSSPKLWPLCEEAAKLETELFKSFSRAIAKEVV